MVYDVHDSLLIVVYYSLYSECMILISQDTLVLTNSRVYHPIFHSLNRFQFWTETSELILYVCVIVIDL